jgi:hypothetical protein
MVDIYRVFHLPSKQHTFFSAAYEIFYQIDHILGHKASLNKFKKMEITSCNRSDKNRIKLDHKNK